MTADEVKKAVAAAKELRPAYAAVLDFYEKLLLAQETSKKELRLVPIEIPEGLLAAKRQGHFPLISCADFSLDFEAAEVLLRKFCAFAADANPLLAEAGPRILQALADNTLDASSLFIKVLQEDDDYLNQTADQLGINKKVLVFAASSSIRPSISRCAEDLAQYLDEHTYGEAWGCPVCGSPPALAFLRDEGGKRFLFCCLCGHEWRVHRICCPYCDNKDANELYYFLSEQEKDCRVDVCDKCKKYIKTIDERELARPVCSHVEHVSTLHLDMMAQEQGLESGVPPWLQT